MKDMDMYLKLDLQLFSQEKTEEATPKKKSEARKEGQIPQSKEIGLAAAIIATFAGLRIFGKWMLDNIMGFTINTIKNHSLNPEIFNQEGIVSLAMSSLMTLGMVVAPVALISMAIGLVTSYLQVGVLFTTKTLAWKLSRLNPIEGFKRMFSKRSVVELIKSLFKIGVLGYIVYSYILDEIPNILTSVELEIGQMAAYLGELVFAIAMRIGLALFIMAALDYLYQRYDHNKKLMMSKQEIKEEHKQSDGNPQIKSKIKEKQRQMAMQRMMQEIPSADVIITNPTHYAVGIKYDKDLYDAPYIIAKGQDNLAQKIKEIAKEHKIPVVENKPLARSLYANAEIGQMIPEELFQSVAEVLAYVYSLNKKGVRR